MGLRGPKPKPFEIPERYFWYLVGLIATDGCLSGDGRHTDITAKSKAYLTRIRTFAKLPWRVTTKRSSQGHIAHRIQISSKAFYDRLTAVGLTPRKSLTIGPLDVPGSWFHEFFRGVIDGDGNIRRWQHPTNGREQWTVRIYGCSEPFLKWLRDSIDRLWRVRGGLHQEMAKDSRHHTKYTLKYGKLAAKVILEKCYYPGALALERKRILAAKCVRVPVGWSKSKTVSDATEWRNWKYVHIWSSRCGTSNRGDADPTAGLVRDSAIHWWAGVAKLVSAHDLKSCVPEGTCGFDSHPRHGF